IFKRKIANRNISFLGEKQMNLFLREKTPLFFSYSNSYYSFPNKTPMENKNWLRSDIIYEFDADEITNDCNKVGNNWECKKSFGEKSLVKETQGENETKQWFLKKSLEQSKKHVFRLIDILEDDFSFSRENVKVNFSGKAGYHIHLRNKEIQNLNKKARIELVDYLTGYGIYYDNLGYEFEKQLICAKKGKWVERINTGLKNFFEKDSSEISLITKLQKTKINQILKNKKEIIRGIDNGFLFSVGARTNKDFWKNVFDFVIQTTMVPIDRQTSIDIHKLIRVPNTLHGETGLIAKEISLKELEQFNPFNDAIAFNSDTIKIFVKEAPKFVLNNNEFGPYKEETIEVPLYCAIFLIGKGAELKQ
ncbi:MAG: DNA primase small subunit domain-containing protein, partial [Candidatus ainarchaeum sp.]|nr:DNA primase small subunit domain-containing protein [Candidatus ainarchaeum sp.]